MNGRRPLRIAFIGARGIGPIYSGIETYYGEVGSRLVSYGHEVLAYCRPHAMARDAECRGITPIFRPALRTKHGETFSHTLISTLDVLARRVDLVQFHALGPALFSWMPRGLGVATVCSIRGLDWKREKWSGGARRFLQLCESMSHRLPDAVSVVSRTLEQHYRDAHGVQVTCIPNGVTIEPSPAPEAIHALGLAGRDYFLFMGRISPEKGVDGIIEAYRAVAGRAKLVIAGHSSYTDDYVARLRASAPPGVIFPGRVDGRLRAELYAHARAMVMPSTIEGLSVAILEAMAFGTCVIASDIPENLELIEGVGLAVPPQNPGKLAEAFRRVLDQPEQALALGRAGRARVEAEYTWDRVARRTEGLYYEVLERRARRATAAEQGA